MMMMMMTMMMCKKKDIEREIDLARHTPHSKLWLMMAEEYAVNTLILILNTKQFWQRDSAGVSLGCRVL